MVVMPGVVDRCWPPLLPSLSADGHVQRAYFYIYKAGTLMEPKRKSISRMIYYFVLLHI